MSLRKYIKSSGIKFIHIARHAGMSPQLLNYYVGKQDIPALLLKKIAEAINDDVDNLIKVIEDGNRDNT